MLAQAEPFLIGRSRCKLADVRDINYFLQLVFINFDK
jgi:hypothetical protein